MMKVPQFSSLYLFNLPDDNNILGHTVCIAADEESDAFHCLQTQEEGEQYSKTRIGSLTLFTEDPDQVNSLIEEVGKDAQKLPQLWTKLFSNFSPVKALPEGGENEENIEIPENPLDSVARNIDRAERIETYNGNAIKFIVPTDLLKI